MVNVQIIKLIENIPHTRTLKNKNKQWQFPSYLFQHNYIQGTSSDPLDNVAWFVVTESEKLINS